MGIKVILHRTTQGLPTRQRSPDTRRLSPDTPRRSPDTLRQATDNPVTSHRSMAHLRQQRLRPMLLRVVNLLLKQLWFTKNTYGTKLSLKSEDLEVQKWKPAVLVSSIRTGVAGPIVNTSAGAVQGYTDHLDERFYLRVDRDIDVYLGIPFAEPPIGDLRFANPVPKEAWTGVWNATYFRPICPQVLPGRLGGKDEDCLYLNVYVPQPAVNLLPVMVWIHGGAYNTGTGGRAWYGGSALAAFGDVIVVTINYRLGPFGFLSTGDESAPGNFGMMDQVLALTWLKDNIVHFGGDPTRVTLFGQSAGGTSIGLHVVSPISQDLFQYAIMQSGSTLTPFGFSDDAARSREEAFRVGENLGCQTTTSRTLIACLRRRSTAQILASALSFSFLSAPVIDGLFLPDNPEVLVAQGRFKRTNVLLGSNHDEGTAWALAAFPRSMTADEPPHMDRDTYDMWHGRFTYGFVNDLVLKAMNQEYFNWTRVDNQEADYLESFVAEITDQTFVAPADALSRAYAERDAGDVYLYHMTHVPTVSVYQITKLAIGPGWMGVTHGEEFQYVFGWSFLPEVDQSRAILPPFEKTFMADVMRYWTNFAKNGNPNSPATVTWAKFSVPEMQYLRLEPVFSTDRALRADTCSFWNTYIPELVDVSRDIASTLTRASTSTRASSTSTRHRDRLWWSSSWTAENVRRSHPQQFWKDVTP
ncbi:acetylcholinesterase-like [Diadema antillarum]|uniref:acetylcholinesterase-like n=1 Tax=Diadema antillarum TaxID=105358 RepID=UPI003A87A760